ncbi:hypothetical protein F4810DRAFT_225371 [Camillea tinctor]|nr:hypothetical protein F4810DRAFT_225371 [Camillea tinctor]
MAILDNDLQQSIQLAIRASPLLRATDFPGVAQPTIPTVHFNIRAAFVLSSIPLYFKPITLPIMRSSSGFEGKSPAPSSPGLAYLDKRLAKATMLSSYRYTLVSWGMRCFQHLVCFFFFLFFDFVKVIGLWRCDDTPSVFGYAVTRGLLFSSRQRQCFYAIAWDGVFAAEMRPATMLLRYRLGTRLVGVAYYRFYRDSEHWLRVFFLSPFGDVRGGGRR